MLGKSSSQNQLDLFKSTLKQMLDPRHELIQLAHLFAWNEIEKALEVYYPNTGQPSHPIRKMVGLLLLKRVYNLSDERVVLSWQENPYFQYFCGETTFQWESPCAASDLCHFRKRIGEKGVEEILKWTIHLHKDKIQKAREVIIDTTVQEKDITFPTDAKLYKKVIAKCNTIAKSAGVALRQSYRFVSQKLIRTAPCRPTKIRWKSKKSLKEITCHSR